MGLNSKQKFWESLFLRLLSVAVLLPITLGALWYGTPYFEALVTIILVFTSFEWVHLICHKSDIKPDLLNRLTFLFMVTLAGIVFFLSVENYALALLTFISIFASTYVIKRKIGKNVHFWWGLGIFILGIPYLCILWIRSLPEIGKMLIFYLLFIVILTDTLAFFAGNYFKGPKLAPKISPNKTWSGAIAGFLGATIVGLIFCYQNQDIKMPYLGLSLVLGAGLLSIFAQIGDLLESWTKRLFGVKDSSNLIPGHGGFLDRLDGFLGATPLLTLFLLILKWMGVQLG